MKSQILLIAGLLLIALLSCNTERIMQLEKELELKELEIAELQDEIDLLQYRNDYLKQFEPDYRIKTLSNEELIELFKNHVGFYCPNGRYRNFRVRMIQRNIYDISFETINPSSGVHNWATGIHRITLLPNDKYEIVLRSGPVCF